MEYHGKFGQTIGRIQHISLMIIIEICYTTCYQATQTVATTLPVFQGTKVYVQYLSSLPHKTIFSLSNYYDGSNIIRLPSSGNQVEYHTTQIFYCSVNICIMLEISTEDCQFQVLFILFFVFLFDGKYMFSHIKPMAPLVDKLDACASLSRKLRLCGDTWKP